MESVAGSTIGYTCCRAVENYTFTVRIVTTKNREKGFGKKPAEDKYWVQSRKTTEKMKHKKLKMKLYGH